MLFHKLNRKVSGNVYFCQSHMELDSKVRYIFYLKVYVYSYTCDLYSYIKLQLSSALKFYSRECLKSLSNELSPEKSDLYCTKQ